MIVVCPVFPIFFGWTKLLDDNINIYAILSGSEWMLTEISMTMRTHMSLDTGFCLFID